jgi:hypothetical protein
MRERLHFSVLLMAIINSCNPYHVLPAALPAILQP